MVVVPTAQKLATWVEPNRRTAVSGQVANRQVSSMNAGQTKGDLTMASGKTIPATARNTCKHPGCSEPAAPAAGPGRPPEYCEGRGHTKVTAWRERRRLAAAQAGTTASPADTDNPVTTARVTGAELLRLLRAETDRVSGIADRLREAVETLTDPTAAEAEVEAVRAAAEQRAAAGRSPRGRR